VLLRRAPETLRGVIDILKPHTPLTPSLPHALALHGTCTGPVEGQYLTSGDLPEFEPKMRIKASKLDAESDRADIELESTGTAHLPPGVQVQIVSTTMIQDAGARLNAPPSFTFTPASAAKDEGQR
jgi:hypothetical protein